MQQEIQQKNKRINELFGTVFEDLRQEMPKYSGNNFFEKYSTKVYVNTEVTYVTVEIGTEKWSFHNRDDTLYNREVKGIELSEDSAEIDDRIEMLLLDAFERTYETIYNSNHKEKIKQESLINSLFEKFVKRRKLETPNQTILNIKKPNKIYI